MSVLIVFLIALTSYAVKAAEVDCTLKPETGLCQAYFPSYFFNSASGECEHFVYGGCGGNSNRFHSKKECEVVCQQSQQVDCTARPEVGLCQAIIPRFYYDSESRECKSFVYGGCGGNTNNFHTQHECQSKCSVEIPEVKLHDCTSKAEIGLCQAIFERAYFNTATGRCEYFIYGGCGGNGNNYQTLEKCHQACGGEVEEPEIDPEGPDCVSQAETGMCRANFPSFFFNTKSGKCELFTYGGCGGNGNNYASEEECQATCGGHKEEIDCESAPETGFCRAYMPNFYFDKSTGSCQKFIYGGCGGNKNRFESEKECLSQCSA